MSEPDGVDGLSTVSSHHDHLLNDLESSEGQLGPTLRAVYESGQQTDFMARLDSRIRTHDKDIERMCNHHYQGFIESVNELLKVRADARKLKVRVKEANDEITDTAKQLLQKGDELTGLRTIERNIVQTNEALLACLPVLELYAKLQDQLKSRRYYPALKSLEQLEHTQLPRVASYGFAGMMRSRIPKLRDSIKQASKQELTDFLENVRDESEKIGLLAMEQTRQRSNIVLATEFNLVKISNEDLDKSVQDLVDFSPVYRCLHIYTVLGERDTFELYYRTQRKHQARLVSERQGNASRTLAAYQSYFYQIAGFFVVEDQVLHTTDGLITRETMDDLWDMAVSKVAAVLRAHEAYSQEALLLRHVKELIVWFNQTMQDYGFNVSQMYDILLEMRDLYNEMLMRSWAYIFKDIFQTDDYTPVTVHNEEDYSRMMKQFPYQDLNLHQLDYPKTFPFSGFVPRVYEQVTHFIDESAKFAENLNLSGTGNLDQLIKEAGHVIYSQTDIDNMVRKSVNLLLTRTLNSCLAAMIKQERLRLPQLIQIWTNMTHLEEACPHWEEAISAVTGTALEQLHSARLYGSSIFKDARKDAETELRDQLKGQLNQFFGLANYQWTPSEIASGPSSYITDMVTFLDSSFQTVFKALPEDVAETCCLDACKHIGKTLVGFLASPEESSQINMNGIKSFNWDIIKCEEFAKTCPVQCSDPNMLQSAFEEIRQLVNLFMNMDWSSYVADYRNQYRSKYPRVKPKTIAAVLEKFKESEQKKSIFTFKRGERDRRRFLDTIIKRLHELADTFVSESGTQIPHTDSNM